jgi:DNA polymerase-3 subunit delta
VPLLTDAQARAALTKGEPLFLLVGDDAVGKQPFLEAASGLVDPDLQGFNLERLYANEGRLEDAIGAIVGAARTLPLLGDRRVVIAHRCEVFLKPKRKGAAADDEDGGGEGDRTVDPDGPAASAMAELERYVASPAPETCLVLVAADMARNTRLARQLLKQAAVVEYWGLKSDREVRGREIAHALHAAEQFVRDRTRDAGLRIGSDAVLPLLEHAGTDISVLRNDVERVITYCLGRGEISAADVRAVVAGAVQVDEWALTRAIQEGDVREALRHLEQGLEAGQSPWMLLGQLAWFVRSRLGERAPGRIPPAVDALFRADVAMKSSGGDPQILLERLIVELCGTDGRRTGGARHWQRG